MSVRQGMLALLAEHAASAHQLRLAFERRTGQTWPVNRGQVATTLDRLVRDGLVEPDRAAGPDQGGAPTFRLTGSGRAELADWWSAPVPRDAPTRDELAIKLALAVGADGVDVASVVRTQRTETLRALQDLRRLVEQLPAEPVGDDLAWSLVLDGLTFDAEAELRWLDHVEGRLRRTAHRATRRDGRRDAGDTDSGPTNDRTSAADTRNVGSAR